MIHKNCLPDIAFVWRPKDGISQAVRLSRQAGVRAIVDFSRLNSLSQVAPFLEEIFETRLSDILLSPSVLMEPGTGTVLLESQIENLWVELHPALVEDISLLLESMEKISEGGCRCLPVCGHLPWLLTLMENHPRIQNLVLKGSEASGFTGQETLLGLFSTLHGMAAEKGRDVNFFLWGGIGTSEAASAFLCAGAKGIVFESLHWLTDGVHVDDALRQGIARLRPHETEVVGGRWQVPCRLFNRGNSMAVRDLKRSLDRQASAEPIEKRGSAVGDRIRAVWVHPLESRFSPHELIPLGIEAGFAGSFRERYGHETQEAIGAFLQDIASCCRSAEKARLGDKYRMAREMGIRYPLIQGAMSWITDVPAFSLAVARAGGLPTIALGLMDGESLKNRVGTLSAVIDGRPYAVNVVALPENPFRDDQLAWIKAHKPPFAVIAAGDPSYARDLQQQGIRVFYIAADERLVRLAFDAGIRYVICEGREAGGHVGQHSTTTLAQLVLELKRQNPGRYESLRLILAGGIFNKQTALIASLLGADAIQMGTAYLATEEIVETGALSPLYQRLILQSPPGMTVVSGESTGLAVRALKSPKTDKICFMEANWSQRGGDECVLRRQIEELSVGSLLVAARGRNRPDGDSLDDETCMKEGQFMSGTCAGAICKVRTVEDLHLEVAQGFLGLSSCSASASGTQPPEEQHKKVDSEKALHGVVGRRCQDRVAITGMSVFNALGNSLESVWEAVLSMRSGIVDIPPSRWNHTLYYGSRPQTPEKTYCRVGAFADLNVNRKELGISPHDFRTMTGSTRMSLWLAKQAVEDSGILRSNVPRERIAVLISQNSGEAAGTLPDLLLRGSIPQILASIRRAIPLSKEQEASIEREIKDGRMAPDDTTLMGRLNCAAGGFLCQKYGFKGPSFAVSAACATSLVALYTAVHLIRSGTIDAALVGGAEEPLTPVHFVEFSALGVLCGITGIERPPAESSRPFDAARDGMVLGEGGAMVLVEKESIARSRGARIHAFISGVGATNSSQGMVESSRETQAMAIRTAFRETSHGPEDVDLIECHATGTLQGDLEEVHALKLFYNGDNRTAITSFKSQIGHTLGSSGLNSLIRGILAMNAGVFPPTLNCTDPDPAMELGTSGLWIPHEPMEWKRGSDRPRHLQVNAFGFGGSNFVMLLEQCPNDADARLAPLQQNSSAGFVDNAKATSLEGVCFFSTRIKNQPYRLAMLAENEEAATRMVRDIPTEALIHPFSNKEIDRMGRQGIHVGWENSSPPALAFVFPGQGSHYAGMGRELYEILPTVREWLDRAASLADFDLRRILFQEAEADLNKTWWQQPVLFSLEFAMAQSLISLGIRPAVLLGHSLGELTALCLAGVFSFEDGFRIVHIRAQCMKKAASMHKDPGVMMAVDAPLNLLEELSLHWEGVAIANVNSPRQVVLGGYREAVEAVERDLKKKGYRCTMLNVSMAFHSPMMGLIRDEFDASIKDIPLSAPEKTVISNITGETFPSDTSQIRKMIVSHIETPVRWMQDVIFAKENHGIRFLLEVGPGEVLTHLILDTLQDVTAIPTCLHGSEIRTYRTALARLFVHGNLALGRDLPSISLVEKDATLLPAPVGKRPFSQRDRSVTAGDLGLEKTVQREINAFVMETYGRFLKPGLLKAIQREHDPSFNQTRLEELLADMFPKRMMRRGDNATGGGQQPHTETAVPQEPPSSPLHTNPETKSSVAGVGIVREDVGETIIRIIMDATGYERDEIQEDHDLRDDLAIRSSRLPVIVDAVEREFGIVVELQNFIHVRTVRDVVIAVQEMMAKDGSKKERTEESFFKGQAQIRRFVFSEIPLQESACPPVSLGPHETVLILSPGGKSRDMETIHNLFRKYGTEVLPLQYLKGRFSFSPKAFHLGNTRDLAKALNQIRRVQTLAGMVVDVTGLAKNRVGSMEDFSMLLSGIFSVIKAFLESPFKKFICLLLRGDHEGWRSRLLFEGLQGLMLSATHEYPSLALRTTILSPGTGLDIPLRDVIEGKYPVMEIRYRSGKSFALAGSESPIVLSGESPVVLGEDRVVVISGGGRGITSHLARALAPFGPKVILLGRSTPCMAEDLHDLLSERYDSEEAVEDLIRKRRPGIPAEELAKAVGDTSRSREALQTLEGLRSAGMEASYMECDVSRSGEVEATLGKIVQQYGRIDGIIHGAGIIRDCLIRDMTPEDFSRVAEVKLLGAWNLYQVAIKSGLRFFICLSSAAAVQGNPGQANYAAANRMMSALVEELRNRHGHILFKTLILPPVQGSGMAEDPMVRQAMKKQNIQYIHVNELCELFLREIAFGKPEDIGVVYARSLPKVKAVLLDVDQSSADSGSSRFNGSFFRNEDFPLIDSIGSLDLRSGSLVAHRSFTEEKDLWLKDHRPLKSIRYPLISGIMVIEAFLEAARILYPYLKVQGVRNIRFREFIECPSGKTRSCTISCRRLSSKNGSILCEALLHTGKESQAANSTNRKTVHCDAQLLIGHGGGTPMSVPVGFPVRTEELDTPAVGSDKMQEYYGAHSELKERYKMSGELDGTGPNGIRGFIVYHEGKDFSHAAHSRYQYSPYLLEAMFHLAFLHAHIREEDQKRAAIPVAIERLWFGRNCLEGEKIQVHGRLKSGDREGTTWDVMAFDLSGTLVMGVQGLRMQWLPSGIAPSESK